MSMQKNILVVIIVILILFILVEGFLYCSGNRNLIQQLQTSLLQQSKTEETGKTEENLVPATFAPGKLLVRFKDNVPEEKQKKMIKDWGFTVEKEIKQIKVKVVSVSEGAEESLAKALSKNPNIDWAEPDYIAEALSIPNDPYFTNQWGMTKIQAPEAWDITIGSSSTNIAIVDTGIDSAHSDLADKVISNINFSGSGTTNDVYGHGTHVAGIAAAITNNAIGVAGLGYTPTIMNVKVLDDMGMGAFSWITSGIIWAADNGAEVINMSLGSSYYSSAMEDAVNYAWKKGVVVVAAAGNNATTTPYYPAYYTNCIAVAATDANDAIASFSNYGDWVDVAAPGVSIISTYKGNSYVYRSGTSMASPHVAGLAALLFTRVRDTNGNGFLNDEVRSYIEANCNDIGVSGIGSGRINVYKTVSATSTIPSPPPDTTPPTVSITSPPNNSTVSGTISVDVSATDNVGVSRVELYKDGVLFATDNTSPYSFAWDTTQDTSASHKLEAKAYDTSGNASISSITVIVKGGKDVTPPTVSIISPTDGQTVPPRGKLLIDAKATDEIGVVEIDLYMDSKLINSCLNTNECFINFSLNNLKFGSHTITAKSYDAQNNIGSATITITKKK